MIASYDHHLPPPHMICFPNSEIYGITDHEQTFLASLLIPLAHQNFILLWHFDGFPQCSSLEKSRIVDIPT